MSSEAKQNKKKISPKAQQIIDIVVTSVEALIVVVCIVVSISVWIGVSDPSDRTINWFAVQTDSMMGDGKENFNPGDLVFTKKPTSVEQITEGTVIVFKAQLRGEDGKYSEEILIHRVKSIIPDEKTGAAYQYVTYGDNVCYTNEQKNDSYKPTYSEIIGVYSGKKLSGFGKVMLWLSGFKPVQTATGVWKNSETGEMVANSKALVENPLQAPWTLTGGYGYQQFGNTTTFLVIIIPLALLFIYNGYIVAKWILNERAKKIRAAALAEAQAGQAESAESEAAIKRAALVEFMKSQGMTDEQIDAYFASQAPAVEPNAEQAPAEETPVQDAETDTQDKPEE